MRSRSDQLLLVDDELELQAELFGSLAAEDHALHENFKIVHDGAEVRVDRQLQLDERAVLVDLQRGLFYGVIHTVVDVERRRVLIANAAAAHIGLVRKDESRCNGVDRHAGALVVVADGRDDRRDVLGPEAERSQNLERHDGAALRVLDAVDQIADVVQIACDLRQLDGVGVVAERFEQIARHSRHMRHMGKAVLRIAQRHERFVRLGDIGADRFIFFDLFKSHKSYLLPVISVSIAAFPAGINEVCVKNSQIWMRKTQLLKSNKIIFLSSS